MGMSQIDFRNIAALPEVQRGNASLPTPPRPSLQGLGTKAQDVPGEAEIKGANFKDKAQMPEETLVGSGDTVKDLELPMTSTRLIVDEETNRIVIQVLDANNQVIKQVPPDEWLKFLSRWDKIQALFFDELV